MSVPTDDKLYEKVKKEVDKTYTKPSAYRSMAYTRFYLKEYKDKYGSTKGAYRGKKVKELNQWREEKWVDIKSYLKDPTNPTACGNEPYEKGEYPLCMPKTQAAKYSKGELELLVKRKAELGQKRLVKDAYLRDVLKPEEIPKSRIYKTKYTGEKLPKPVAPAKAEKILKEQPIGKSIKKKKMQEETVQEVTIPTTEVKRPRGRPKLSAEQLAINKQASLQRRKEARQKIKEVNQAKREEERKLKEEEKARAKAEAEQNRLLKPSRDEESANLNRAPVAPVGGSVEDYERYARQKIAWINRVQAKNNFKIL